MPRDTQYQPFPYRTAAGTLRRDSRAMRRSPSSAPGRSGLALAIDLALHGVKSVVLDDNNVVSVGSRAICWAKRTLEIFDRLGVGERMVAKGVTWKIGRLFHGEREVYAFDLLPEAGPQDPAFINLQQYYVEAVPGRTLRAISRPDRPALEEQGHRRRAGRAITRAVDVETPDGSYRLDADYLVACDGARRRCAPCWAWISRAASSKSAS